MGEGEGLDEAADAATPEGEDDGGSDAGGPRWPVVLVATVVAGVVLISGVALAAVGRDPSPSPDASIEAAPSERSTSTTTEPDDTTATSTTLAPTTTAAPAAPVSEPAPAAGVPASRPPATQAPPPPPRRATCNPLWPPGTGPMPTIFVPPGKFVAFAPPAAGCVNEADGCLVAVTLRWSDGYTEVGSAVLAEPGQYTVKGDRGTTWTVTVTNDLVCSSNGGDWSNLWPPGT